DLHRICLREMRTPRVYSAAGELFWMGVREFFRSLDILHSSRTGWDRCSGRGDPAEFGTLGSGSASRSTPARRGLIREKLLATRGKIATRYTEGQRFASGAL